MTAASSRAPRKIPQGETDDARNAALRGALRAFAGPHAKPVLPPPPPARASTLAAPRLLPQKDSRITAPITPVRSGRPAPSRRSLSTSNVAASVAASRSAQNAQPTSRVEAVKQSNIHAHPRRAETDPDTVHEVLPSPGTVRGAAGYFESLQNGSLAKASAGSGQDGLPTPPLASNGRRERPSLSLKTGSAVMAARALPAEIHSPTPIRPPSGAAAAFTVLVDGNAEKEDQVSHVEPFETPIQAQTSSLPAIAAPSKPMAPPPRRSTFKSASEREDDDGFKALSLRPKSAGSRLDRSKRGSPQNTQADNARRIDSLANAIVASHLASSRAPSRTASPAKMLPPPLTRRTTEDPRMSHHSMASTTNLSIHDSRTPSPKKAFRQTLRKSHSPVDTTAEIADKHKRSHFSMRKHPHKHHEGDRKRWRDEVTLLERKRYEGLWAANRDLYMEQADGYVCNLVVRDIWCRSRLPMHVLEEVWELVDHEKDGRLNREAFVVGTWLVDQRLKGRKLPVAVGESVWHSVRGIYGLKIPKIK